VGADGLVALTFDDCDAEDPWLAILDVLRAHGAGATFFPNGFRVGPFPRAALRTSAAGHDVGSHGFDHMLLTALGSDEIRSRIETDREAWRSATGTRLAPFLRPPFGAFDDVVARAAAKAGVTHIVLWDVDPRDWTERDASEIADDVAGSARAGSIVELHATPWTAEALPAVLDRLAARGLRPVTLSQLLARSQGASLAETHTADATGG
jgi:peptidoglycan/xylan/chitin deacetylase (PgdA/CDA1 family)